MSRFNDLVPRHSINNQAKLQNICRPLEQLSLPYFCYFRIDSDGRFGNLSNYPPQLDFYYSNDLHKDNPLFIDPRLIRSGCMFTPCVFEPTGLKRIYEKFQIHHAFFIFRRLGDTVEVFGFTTPHLTENSPLICPDYFLLNDFIFYFKMEAKQIIDKMMNDGFNIKEERGAAFHERDSRHPLLCKDKRAETFLDQISPLSNRERECLMMLRQGYSVKKIACVLNLSPRTVQHYLENTKNKLGCVSTDELLGC